MKRRLRDVRRVEESVARAAMVGSMVLVLACLAGILGAVAVKGFGSLSVEMITRVPKGGYYIGEGGGILNAIVGSLLVGIGATILAVCAGLPVALYINVYAGRRAVISRVVRFVMDLMWGIPSIVYGAFGFLLMVALGMRASLGAAIATVAILELPILVRGADEALRMVPPEIEEASYGLGATRLETAVRVILRQAAPGLVTAVLIAFGRAIGDTAAVLFTAGFTDNIPTSLGEPAATLPLAVFFQLGTPFPEVRGRAYAAAAILTLIVFAASVVSRLAFRSFSRHAVR